MKKSILISASVAALTMASSAHAQSVSDIVQTGEGGEIVVTQENANISSVVQSGLINAANINQTIGTENDSVVLQDGGENNLAQIDQLGVGNVSDVTQIGGLTETAVVQQEATAANSSATILQISDPLGAPNSNNIAVIVQADGSDNVATVETSGINNLVEVVQLGDGVFGGNDADVFVAGDTNTAFVTQSFIANNAFVQVGTADPASAFNEVNLIQDGSNGIADVLVDGSDNSVFVNQGTGSDGNIAFADVGAAGGSSLNEVSIEQFGSNNASAIFQGELEAATGNVATTLQDGVDNLSVINQSGEGNTADVTQLSDGNTSTILQSGAGNLAIVTQQ